MNPFPGLFPGACFLTAESRLTMLGEVAALKSSQHEVTISPSLPGTDHLSQLRSSRGPGLGVVLPPGWPLEFWEQP